MFKQYIDNYELREYFEVWTVKAYIRFVMFLNAPD